MPSFSALETDVDQLRARLADLLANPRRARAATMVIVSSLTLHADELRKIQGPTYFEQRLLYELRRLTRPEAKVVYVTSQRIDPEILAYTRSLIPDLAGADLAGRLVLLDCADGSPRPLTHKILRRPELIDRIRAAIPDPGAAYLVTYNSTPAERELSLRLGIPLYACDPGLQQVGNKSGGRRVFRAAGVPTPAGYEDLRSEDEVIEALIRLKQANPGLRRAVIKLNESFAGVGNAVFHYAAGETPDSPSRVAYQLHNEVKPLGDDWTGFAGKLAVMGAIAEEYLGSAASRSPSAQLLVEPGGAVRVISTHDQILGGPNGQTFIGCSFPARDAYRQRVQQAALAIGRVLAERGVIGNLSVDFLAEEHDAAAAVAALEVNLRMSGTTAPFNFMDAVLGGEFDEDSGTYSGRDGSPRGYVASDRIQLPGLRGASVAQLVGAADDAGLHYDPDAQTGTLFLALGALPELGRFGLLSIGRSPQEAQRFYDRTLAVLNERFPDRGQ